MNLFLNQFNNRLTPAFGGENKNKIMNIKELKLRHSQGTIISFSETNHPKIPNTVLFDGSVVGTVRKQTIVAFRKFLNQKP